MENRQKDEYNTNKESSITEFVIIYFQTIPQV